MNESDLLTAYVEAHNIIVTTRNVASLAALLNDNASLYLEGFDVGPYHGKEEILSAFMTHPPTDTLIVDSVRTVAERQQWGQFRWSANPDDIAGEIMVASFSGDFISIIHIRRAPQEAMQPQLTRKHTPRHS